MADYLLTFYNIEEDSVWSTSKTRLGGNAQRIVKEMDIDEFKPESNYNMTLTFITALGSVLSSTKFSKCEKYFS